MIIAVPAGRSAADLMHESGSETVQSRRGNSPEEAISKQSRRPQSAAVTRDQVPTLQLTRQGKVGLPELAPRERAPQEGAPATAAAWDSLSLISSSSEASMPGGHQTTPW